MFFRRRKPEGSLWPQLFLCLSGWFTPVNSFYTPYLYTIEININKRMKFDIHSFDEDFIFQFLIDSFVRFCLYSTDLFIHISPSNSSNWCDSWNWRNSKLKITKEMKYSRMPLYRIFIRDVIMRLWLQHFSEFHKIFGEVYWYL